MSFVGSRAPEIDADSWINSDPVSLENGTYLLDFWSYSCRGCLKVLEEIRRLHDENLTVVSIHSPEFGFERDLENLRNAVERLGIEHPVAFDPDKEAWNSYSNSYWPSLVLVSDGEIVWREMNSSLENLEEKLSELLGVEPGIESFDSDRKSSPDAYFGYRRGKGRNAQPNFRGEKTLSAPQDRRIDSVYLDGTWKQKKEYIQAGQDARIFYHFRGSSAYFVAHPNDGIRDIEVFIDGDKVSHPEAGDDLNVEEKSFVRVKNPGLFSAVERKHSRAELVLEPEEGTRIYSVGFE